MIKFSALSAAIAGIALTASAADPVAVWDGDFTATQTGFTLNRSGNAISQDNSTITIDQDVGVKVDFTTGLSDAMTVMFKYSDLAFDAQKTLVTSFCNGGDENRTGVYAASGGTINGIWNTADWAHPAQTLSASSGVLAFCYSKAGGTSLYSVGASSRSELFNESGLRAGNDTAINGCTIGGERAKSGATLLGAATGMKITGIAIFDGILTEAEMTGYVWPSETQDFNLTVSEDKTWSEVLSAAGVTEANKETANLVITAENNPKITFDIVDSVLYGLTVNGSAVFSAGDEVYGSGAQSFGKTLLATSMKTTTEGCLSLPNVEFEVKDGWKGAFITSASDIKLYAQNTETISINIGGGDKNTSDVQPSPEANLVTGDEYAGLYPTPGTAWNNISGHWSGSAQTVTLTSAKAFDGETTTVRNTVQLSGTANNTWAVGTAYTSVLRGYLDDTGAVEVKIVGVPYSKYDVIIYATSDSSLDLNYFTINGTNYTCGEDGVATEGTGTWGAGQTTTPVLGKNAMLVEDVTGTTLTISGSRLNGNSSRVTVCAVQIINKGEIESSDWSANLNSSTTFNGGNGTGLSDQSGTWANSSLGTIIITNTADAATLTLDGEITAGTLKIVGAAGKNLSIAKDSGATLDIAVYDLTESAEEAIFLFNPDFSKVNAGTNLIGVGYDYTGAVCSGFHYIGSANTLTLGTVNGGSVTIGGGGTITNDLEVAASATVTLSGSYTTSGFSRLGATKGTVVVDYGADVTFSSVLLANSGNGENYNRLDVNGMLRVSSVSTTSSVYDKRNSYEGILFGHWKGTSTVNVGAGGSILAENAWMQLSYTTNSVVTINGGAVKVLGINGGPWAGSYVPELTLTGGGSLEFAESPINMGGVVRNYGYGTIKTYSHGGSTGWTDPGAITFTDAENGTTIDPCGMTNVFSGALSGAGKIIVNDSVGGGSVSFTGNASNFTGDIAVGANSTLNLGVTRPAGTLTVNGTLTVQMQTGSDVIELSTSAQPANVILYDANGDVVSNPSISYSDGTLTIMPPPKTLPASGTVAFDTESNWKDSAMPVEGDYAIIELSDDAEITVSGTYTLNHLFITGSGVATFSGEGSITVANISVKNGATFTRNAKISATTGISLDAGTVLRLDGVTENAAISGAGAVETYGTVVLANANTMTGGITVKPGSALSTSVEPVWADPSTKAVCNTGFGLYDKDWEYSSQSRVTVEDGGCVDIANVADKDAGVALAVAGKGILIDGEYSGAVKYSGSDARGSTSRQISSLTLTADALVDIGAGCGLVHSGHEEAFLDLAGYALTIRGTGTVPMVNVSSTAGKIILDGAALELSKVQSDFTGVSVVAKGCAAIDIAIAPVALGSLTIEPAAGGTTASNWNLPANCVPVVNTSNVDPSGLSNGQSVVLFTDTNEHLVYGSNIVWQVGGRFEGHNDAHEVTATFAAGIPQPLLHYDFNNGTAVDTGKASDSKYQISSFDGEAGSETLVNGRKGKAVQVHTGYTPYWSSTSFGNSPVHAGEVTVTTVARLNQTGIILWGLGNVNNANTALGLVAPTANSASVIMRNPNGTVTTLATVTDIGDLTKSWHFFAIVADANGTTFYVDDSKATSVVPAATAIGQQGQLGSFYGGAPTGYSKAGDAGYCLDDWRVYDAALTAREIGSLKRKLLSNPFILRLK